MNSVKVKKGPPNPNATHCEVIIITSFKQAARHASLVEVKMRALSCPRIIEFGTLSKFQGLLQTLSEKIKKKSTTMQIALSLFGVKMIQ